MPSRTRSIPSVSEMKISEADLFMPTSSLPMRSFTFTLTRIHRTREAPERSFTSGRLIVCWQRTSYAACGS
jgi:hypothetical protein